MKKILTLILILTLTVGCQNNAINTSVPFNQDDKQLTMHFKIPSQAVSKLKLKEVKAMDAIDDTNKTSNYFNGAVFSNLTIDQLENADNQKMYAIIQSIAVSTTLISVEDAMLGGEEVNVDGRKGSLFISQYQVDDLTTASIGSLTIYDETFEVIYSIKFMISGPNEDVKTHNMDEMMNQIKKSIRFK